MASNKEISSFQRKVLCFYSVAPRIFPWRNSSDSYVTLVSEFMLQQTQTGRVLEKFETFMNTFPTLTALAHAPLSSVLIAWQGLGYNRRAKFLHQTAREIVKSHNAEVPSDPTVLDSLPGIGPYTAAAISTFAYNKPNVFIETNIRSVYIHTFFNEKTSVSDNELIPLIKKSLYTKDPRRWYYALMDYGVFIKKSHPNPNKKSTSYTKQSQFEGSTRQKRGAILKILSRGPAKLSSLEKVIAIERNELTRIVETLSREGLLLSDGDRVSLMN